MRISILRCYQYCTSCHFCRADLEFVVEKISARIREILFYRYNLCNRNTEKLTRMVYKDMTFWYSLLTAYLTVTVHRLTCSSGSSLIPWIPAMCPFLSVMERTGSLMLFTTPLTGVTFVCPVLQMSHGDDICIITGALGNRMLQLFRRIFFNIELRDIILLINNSKIKPFSVHSKNNSLDKINT